MQTIRPTLMLCAALMLVACGSGTTDAEPASGPAAGPILSDGNDANDAVDPGSDADAAPDTGSDTDGGGDTAGGENPPGGSPGEESAGADGAAEEEGAGEEGSGEENPGGTGDGTDAGGGTGSDVDVGGDAAAGDGEGSEPEVISPGIPGNIAATRLILGMERVLKATLLELNGRYTLGLPLSEQQQTCLGSYDPELGEPAFAIGCERGLATGEVEVYVERGALYRTDVCAADLAAGSAERCVMESARVLMRTRFGFAPGSEGQRRPRPLPGSGVVVSYAIDAPLLVLESDDQAPLVMFDCAFELQNGALLPSIGGRDVCDAQVRDAADYIDFLAPVIL